MSRLFQPFLVGNGGGVNSTSDLVLPYGPNETGDLFRIFLNVLGSSVPVTPAGCFLVDSSVVGGVGEYIYDRALRSSGSEVGNLTVTIALDPGIPHQGVILTYRNVRLGDYTEALSQGTAAGAGPTSIAGPTIAAAGPGRLGCLYTGSNNNATPATVVTGQTGATWIDRFQWDSGLGALMDVQSAALGNAFTVTGGTMSMPGSRAVSLANALIGASQRQATAFFHVTATADQFAFVTCPLEGARAGDSYTFAPYNVTGFSVADTSSAVELFCATDDVVTAKIITTNPTGFDSDEDWILALGLPDL